MSSTGRSPISEPVISLVGCAGAVGREIKVLLAGGRFRSSRVHLFETGSQAGVLTDFGDEPAVALRVEPDSFENTDLLIVATGARDEEEILAHPRKAGAVVIGLAPTMEPPAPVVNWNVNRDAISAHHGIVRAAEPISLMLSSILATLDSTGSVASAEAVVLEPASGLGPAGVDELYQQTVSLLNFGSVRSETIGRQLAFNLVPLSMAPPPGGAEREEAIIGQIGRILDWREVRLSLKVVLAPVFHCHTIALRVRLARPVPPERLRALLADGEPFDRGPGEGASGDAATPVEWAGQEKIRIAEIREDGRGAVWIWALVDDLKGGAAHNAVKIAEALFPG